MFLLVRERAELVELQVPARKDNDDFLKRGEMSA